MYFEKAIITYLRIVSSGLNFSCCTILKSFLRKKFEIIIDYPNCCIMEISCIIDSVLKPTDFLPLGKKFN